MKQSESTPENGPHKEFFADGELSAEGQFRNGKRHCAWRYYHKNGNPKARGEYVEVEFESP